MRRAALLAVVGVVVLFYSSPAPAQSTSTNLGTAAVSGTTIKVNTNADESNTDGDCSLREAIKAANTNTKVDRCAAGSSTDRDAIHFALGTQARITLGSTLPAITDRSGLSIDGQQAKITVSGNDKVGVFIVSPGRQLALLHLSVANGFNSGTGDLAFGGILLNIGGTLKVSSSTFSGNHSNFEGGAIHNIGGTLEVNNSTFSGNRAEFGGGIVSEFHSTLKVSNSTFSDNRAQFGGGGIWNDRAESTVTVSNSTLSGNSSFRGGGISNVGGGTLTVTNSTFSGNSAPGGGSGILNSNTASLKNTIVANSTKGKNCLGKITDGGYNIADDDSCHFSVANHSLPSTNPKLASSLANNGGPTKTIALLTGSLAINAIPQGTNGCGTKITTDQRGVKRPQGNRCEIGAFEKKQ
jgi:CSLREA domain-containing protein